MLCGLQEGNQRIVALTLDVHFHVGQQATDGRLVDDALLVLIGNRVA